MLIFFLRLAARLPLSWLHSAGAALGWLVYWCSPTYSARLRENLHASGVCAGDAQCAPVLRAAIAAAGQGVTDVAAVWLGADETGARLVVECERWNIVEAARARGNGVIFLTPHLGCFEISALYGARHMPLTVLSRPPKLGWIEPLMIAGRSRWQAVVAPANLRGVRMLYKALARGEAVGLLPDQAPGVGEGVWVDFFGGPAYTMTLVRRVEHARGAAMIMAFAERLPAGRGYRLHREALRAGDFGEAALNRAVEAQVRQCPGQYLWSYNRYKVPAGAPEPYRRGERREA